MSHVSKGPRQVTTWRHPAYFYGSAREGLKDFLEQSIRKHGRGKVLLPGYIGWSPREGSGVFDPIKALRLDTDFYRVRADLSADLESLVQLTQAEEYRVLVVIHYFGRPEPRLAEIRSLTARKGITLVEDLAHGFFGSWLAGNLGDIGDLQLYSLHKMFPLEHGGMVTYRDQSLVSGQRSTHPELATEVLSYDWRSIASHRREVFRETTALLRRLPEHGALFSLLWPDLGSNDVPQSIPIRVARDNRDRVYEAMNSRGFGLVSLYHTLIEETTDPVAHDLSRHIINLPCHQDVLLDQIPALVEAFSQALRS